MLLPKLYEAVSPHCCQYWGLSVILMFSYKMGSVSHCCLACIPLITTDAEDFFICSMATWISSVDCVNVFCPFFSLGVSFLLMCQFFWRLNCSLVTSILLSRSSPEKNFFNLNGHPFHFQVFKLVLLFYNSPFLSHGRFIFLFQ